MKTFFKICGLLAAIAAAVAVLVQQQGGVGSAALGLGIASVALVPVVGFILFCMLVVALIRAVLHRPHQAALQNQAVLAELKQLRAAVQQGQANAPQRRVVVRRRLSQTPAK